MTGEVSCSGGWEDVLNVARVLKEISTWQEMGLPLCLEAQIFGYPNLLGHQIGINWL